MTLSLAVGWWAVAPLDAAQLRVLTYNTEGGPRQATATVLEAIGPIDVLALQEQYQATTPAIADLLNGIYGAEPTPPRRRRH